MIDSFLKYLKFEKRVSPNTVLAYQNDLNQVQHFLQQNFPEDSLEQADHGTLRSWLVMLIETGIEPVSVNRKIATLRTFYKFLLRREVISKDPMTKIRVLKTKKKLPSFVKEKEINEIIDNPSLATTENETVFERVRNQLMLEILYATGIRLSELINLQENRVDLHLCTIKVLGKRNKERVIPFSADLKDLIRAYVKIRNKEVGTTGDNFLFVTEKGEKCYPVLVQRMVKRYLTGGTTSEKTSPHVLRHSFATHLLDKGAEINAVKDLLGHSSLAATQVYTHNSMEKLKKAFDQAHPKA